MQEKENITDIKAELFNLFRKQGLDHDLKAHMRAQLLNRIRGQKQVKSGDLKFRMICSLFMDFLRQHGFSYTPSVFVPECGHSDKLLSQPEICQLLGLNLQQEKSMLEFMLEYFENLQKQPPTMESYAQTEDSAAIATLEERLRLIDMQYINKTRTDIDPTTIEERMLRYQRECDARMRNELAAEITRIREIEISAMRIEEANKYRQQLQLSRAKEEEQWRQKLDSLKERERESRERLAIREKEIEAKEFSQRQQFLKDIEQLKQRESDMQKSAKLEIQAAEIEKKSWEAKRKEVESKLKDLEVTRQALQNKAEEDFLQYKREFERKYEEDRLRMITEKAEIEAMKKSLESESVYGKQAEDRAEKLAKECERLEGLFKEANKDREKFRNEIKVMREQMKIVSEAGRRDLDMLALKDKEIETVKSELLFYKETLEEFKSQTRERELQYKDLLTQFSSSYKESSTRPKGIDFVDNSYLKEREGIWKELQQEEEDIKKVLIDFMKPPATKKPDPFAGIQIPKKEHVIQPPSYQTRVNFSPERNKMSPIREGKIYEENDTGRFGRSDEKDKRVRYEVTKSPLVQIESDLKYISPEASPTKPKLSVQSSKSSIKSPEIFTPTPEPKLSLNSSKSAVEPVEVSKQKIISQEVPRPVIQKAFSSSSEEIQSSIDESESQDRPVPSYFRPVPKEESSEDIQESFGSISVGSAKSSSDEIF